MTGRATDDRVAVRRVRRILAVLVASVALAACAVPGTPGPGSPATGGAIGAGAARSPDDPEIPGSAAPLPAPGAVTAAAPAGSADADAPVIRHGVRPHPGVPATAGAFLASAPVRYPDRVSVTVVAVRHGTEHGSGPGTFAGRPYSALTFLMLNGSAHSVDLGAVAVRASFGIPGRPAAPVYADDSALDFSGTLRPGGMARATYLFAVPPAESRTFTAAVDFDGVHAAAVFRGGLR